MYYKILLQCIQKSYILKIAVLYSPNVTKRSSKPQATLLWTDVKHINSPSGLPDPISGYPVKRIADGHCPSAIFFNNWFIVMTAYSTRMEGHAADMTVAGVRTARNHISRPSNIFS